MSIKRASVRDTLDVYCTITYIAKTTIGAGIYYKVKCKLNRPSLCLVLFQSLQTLKTLLQITTHPCTHIHRGRGYQWRLTFIYIHSMLAMLFVHCKRWGLNHRSSDWSMTTPSHSHLLTQKIIGFCLKVIFKVSISKLF